MDMAPPIRQSDCMGPGILAGAIGVCVHLLGIDGRQPWKPKPCMRPLDEPEIREQVRAAVGMD